MSSDNPLSEFIRNDLGGTQAVAEKLGCKPNAVRMWICRKKLPRDAWPELLQAYDGLTLDRLREVERQTKGAA